MLDVWALGILLYELVHGNAPFRGNQAAIARNQTRQAIAFKQKLSQEYKDLVNRFLKEDPDQRIPLIEVFQHKWVLYFQQKFFANWQPTDTDSEDEYGSCSDDDDEEEEEEGEEESELDSDELEEPDDSL